MDKIPKHTTHVFNPITPIYYRKYNSDWYVWRNSSGWVVSGRDLSKRLDECELNGTLTPVEGWAEDSPKTSPTSAPDILKEARDCISDRASERDTESERSMKATVGAFNVMFDTNLTEEQGWMFMVFLKAARARGGDFRKDDYVDGAAYFALAGESHGK